MTGTTRSSSDLDPRRRKALFRSWHRGTREMDLVLGRFADAEIGSLDRITRIVKVTGFVASAEGFHGGEDGYPSPGRVAWDAWGGDPGRDWAESQKIDGE